MLTIQEKIDMLKQLDAGSSVKSMCTFYGVGVSTVYDIKKQKDELCKFYVDSESKAGMEIRKTLRPSKSCELDEALMKWFRQRRSEGLSISGPMLTEQAKIFHAELKLDYECDFSLGWLHKFKKRHGISLYALSGEKLSADTEAAEKFVLEFAQLVSDEKLTPEQVYNADETALYWRCMPRNTLCTPNDAHIGMKESKERITVLGCSNAAGTHKIKLLVIGKSMRPRKLKDVKVMPVEYTSSKKAWVTTKITTDWFNNTFIRQARQHCNSVGLDPNCKILLVLDNCSAHPPAETLSKDNVQVIYLPPNCTSLIQPQDQGILRSLKCRYRSQFLRSFLTDLNGGKTVEEIKKDYSLKDTVWALARAWDSIPKSTLNNAWHKLWPTIIFTEENENEPADFRGFSISQEKKMADDLMKYAKTITCPEIAELQENNIEEWFSVDCDVPVVHHYTDEEIVEMVTNKNREDEEESEDSDVDEPSEKITQEECIFHVTRLIAGLEQRSYISEQQLMSLYLLKKQLEVEKSKQTKQTRITDMFKILSSPVTSAVNKTRDETAGPSCTHNPTTHADTSDSE